MEEKAILPVTILTGFLGSGKTTLINYLLEHNSGEMIAIVENEFGSVGVDGELLKGHANVEVIELSNGCVCCSIRGELTEALQGLLSKIDSGAIKLDRLILETTGVADPAPIVQTFFLDETLKERIALDAVIVLADAIHLLKQLDEHRVCAAQIGFADRIILTKADVVDASHKAEVLARIHAINAKADIFEAYRGALPKETWVGIHAFELDDMLKLNQGFFQINAAQNSKLKFTHFNPTAQKHSFNDDIASYVFEAGELDLHKIGAFMEELIEENGNDMLRYKGIFAIANEENRLIVQGVHKVVGFDYGSPWQEAESKKSLLVIIGRSIAYDTLKEKFLQTHA